MATDNAPNYLNPDLPSGLSRFRIPIIEANPLTVKDYGLIVDDPTAFEIEICRWPAQGWRPVDSDSGHEGGVAEGTFTSEWRGEILFGSNQAVGGEYILGYGTEPKNASEQNDKKPEVILMWHANYHPDGGQMFFPLDNRPYLVPLALPGDDIRPEHFVCFFCDGTKGLYIHPNIWHEGVFSIQGKQSFLDRQGAVHARVSVDFAREFRCLLEIPLSGVM
jgi:ureidoglycolate lyase